MSTLDLSFAAYLNVGRISSCFCPRAIRGSTAREQQLRGATVDGGMKMGAADFIRPHIRRMAPYTPIQPLEVLSKKLGRPIEEIVKLDANENPYGPPPEVREALGQLEYPHIYPDPECLRLREALALDCGLPVEHLLVGCGADELIDLIMRCVLEPGDAIVDCPPTFTMYAFDAAVNNSRVITVPRLQNFRIDVNGIRVAVLTHRPKILFLTSPNNPDGSMVSSEEIEEMLQLPVLVVLDEAYIEFSDAPSHIQQVQQRENLIVLRTFSKRAGLAGLRVGYGAFPLPLIEFLWRAKQPYNVSVVAQAAACAALANPVYLRDVRDKLVAERGRLLGMLRKIPFLEPYESNANFILCRVLLPHFAKDIKEALQSDGVMVRYYSKAELSNFIRISVGRPQDTDRLMLSLSSITPE
eukprot:TRINITY_DN4534_c0_g1_i1.p1 TRINITY_DN4534_c0_g1~~TRINITY_DN4534_c0_g1_i1.p1  ORF type:complete len:412 (-),score=106.12 TRINITY_DN4534_c0_g1_i1:149-1384(-)